MWHARPCLVHSPGGVLGEVLAYAGRVRCSHGRCGVGCAWFVVPLSLPFCSAGTACVLSLVVQGQVAGRSVQCAMCRLQVLQVSQVAGAIILCRSLACRCCCCPLTGPGHIAPFTHKPLLQDA
jgi:hypothetical protein